MKLSYDRRIAIRQIFEHAFDLLVVVDSLHVPVRCRRVCLLQRRLMGVDVTQGFGLASVGDFANGDASRDDSQIRGQRTVATKPPKRCKIIGQQGDEYLGAEIIDICWTKPNTSGVSRVIYYVDKQTYESIYKVLPPTRLLSQTAFQEVAINFGECHGRFTRKLMISDTEPGLDSHTTRRFR